MGGSCVLNMEVYYYNQIQDSGEDIFKNIWEQF